MSSSASIKWTIRRKSTNVTWVSIILVLLENGWSPSDHGEMSYLPLNDNGRFDWLREPLNEEKLVSVLTRKETEKESLGVCITWKGTNIGGSLLTVSDDELLLSININRKTIQLTDNETITDINWYLKRTNCILVQNEDITIITTVFTEII